VVALTGGAKEDAHAVFGLLGTAFASDRAADDAPQDAHEDRPTVWTATFEVRGPGSGTGSVRLTQTVTATLQGAYTAVDTMRETLASSFDVRVIGAASGDQEEEVQLRLGNKR
jgi:hypothetical protein